MRAKNQYCVLQSRSQGINITEPYKMPPKTGFLYTYDMQKVVKTSDYTNAKPSPHLGSLSPTIH